MLDRMSQLWMVLQSLFTTPSLSSQIEKYVVSRHPQNTSDVEKFTRDFQIYQGYTKWL